MSRTPRENLSLHKCKHAPPKPMRFGSFEGGAVSEPVEQQEPAVEAPKLPTQAEFMAMPRRQRRLIAKRMNLGGRMKADRLRALKARRGD